MRAIARFSYVLAVTAAFVAANGTARADDFPQITVSGEGTVSVAPDSANLRAGVITEGKTAKDAGEANAKAMAAVIAAIKDAGIADKDAQTSRYAIRPVYDGGRPVRERITGFQASNSAALTVRELDKIGGLIDRLIAAGAAAAGPAGTTAADATRCAAAKSATHARYAKLSAAQRFPR